MDLEKVLESEIADAEMLVMSAEVDRREAEKAIIAAQARIELAKRIKGCMPRTMPAEIVKPKKAPRRRVKTGMGRWPKKNTQPAEVSTASKKRKPANSQASSSDFTLANTPPQE